jgi:hypothetical protein
MRQNTSLPAKSTSFESHDQFEDGFFEAFLLRPMGFEKQSRMSVNSPGLLAPLARYRPRYPFPGCVPAEPASVFPGVFNVPSSIDKCKNHLDAGDHA